MKTGSRGDFATGDSTSFRAHGRAAKNNINSARWLAITTAPKKATQNAPTIECDHFAGPDGTKSRNLLEV